MRQYLTYQHNVQKLFRDHADKYDGVVIPLSIATAFPSGTYGFVRALCSRHRDKQYAIDPRNALFQQRWDRSSVREPHRKMARALGPPFDSKGLARPLTPRDLNGDVLDACVKRCLDFQRLFHTREEDQRKLAKYRKLLGINTLGELGDPQFLVPPYFQFSTFENDEWFAVNQKSIDAAMRHRMGIDVRPVLHFEDWPDADTCENALSWLAKLEITDFWLYPNFFKEHDAPLLQLQRYRATVQKAVQRKLQPYSLFGGYFAILLSYVGLEGFGNGIGYGEWRDSGYHRGGSAATRVYLRRLHRYLDAPAAQHVVERDPDYFGSDTEIIAGYVEEGESLVNMSLAESLDHFMECRQQEIEFVTTNPKSQALNEIDETLDHLADIGQLERHEYGDSLDRWRTVIAAS